MRRLIVLALGLTVFVGLALLAVAFQSSLAEVALDVQRQSQNALAGALRAMRNGQPGAVLSFLGLCYLYGLLHALGPGHGKGVIAAYAAAAPVASSRIMMLAGLSSFLQSVTAVLVVYGAVWLLNGARDSVEALASRIEPISFAFLALLGLMVALRAVRRLTASAPGADHPPAPHAHHHGPHDDSCGCGHSHAADPASLAAAGSWKETVALIASVALRPCTSALFVLFLTWRLDLDAIGIIGALAMGVGTMTVTLSAGLAATAARRGVLRFLPEQGALFRGLVVAELLLGSAILIFAGITAVRLL